MSPAVIIFLKKLGPRLPTPLNTYLWFCAGATGLKGHQYQINKINRVDDNQISVIAFLEPDIIDMTVDFAGFVAEIRL